MLEINHDYEAALKRILQLERLNATLSAEIDAQRQREQALSEAYLRLRRLIGRRAFDTPHGPTAEQVWTTTEIALAALVAEINRMRPVVEAAIEWKKYGLAESDNDELLEAINDYEESQPK